MMNDIDIDTMKAGFETEQNELSKKLVLRDSFIPSELKTCAGVDLAYWEEDGKERAVCCIVVIDMHTHEVIENKRFDGFIEVPYMPGFLAYRELPLIKKCMALLETKPDIWFFDGNGYLHPRHMGSASQASFLLPEGTPTVGVAKTYYRVKGAEYTEPAPEAGSFTDIVIEGEAYGRVLRTHEGVKPVFVSAGNNITLETASQLTLALTDKESHIPIPTRIADLETHIAREELRNGVHQDKDDTL